MAKGKKDLSAPFKDSVEIGGQVGNEEIYSKLSVQSWYSSTGHFRTGYASVYCSSG